MGDIPVLCAERPLQDILFPRAPACRVIVGNIQVCQDIRHDPTDGVYPEMAPAILNTGRYIATTRPPITVPRNTIIKGSIMEVRLSTA